MIRRLVLAVASWLARNADAPHADGGLSDRPLPDGAGVRRAREIHGMTVPEFTESNERFAEIIAREFPDQT